MRRCAAAFSLKMDAAAQRRIRRVFLNVFSAIRSR
jgi:hypothetical protein